MKRNVVSFLVVALAAVGVQASNINVSVQGPNGESEVFVAPNGTVNYRIVANLSDATNEGLALIGLSLHYTEGAIGQQANTPSGAVTCGNPMPAFVIPDGITNPAGFGGTMIGGDLIQVGGAQNTINNNISNAPFPIGAVLAGVAKPGTCGQAIIATGSFTRGAGAGPFQLQAFDVFANVIKAGETGVPFWATEAAGVGAVTSLTVSGVVPTVNLVSSLPPFTGVGVATVPAGGTLWRSASNTIRFTFSGALPGVPTAGQIEVVELLAGGAFGANLAANGFTFALESGNTVLKVVDGGTTDLLHRHWYAIRNTGGWSGVGNFEAQFPVQEGDSTGDNRVLQADVGFIASNVACVTGCGDQNRSDINGDGRVLQADAGLAASRVSSLPVIKPTGH